jgi:signal transduction histidine kinase
VALTFGIGSLLLTSELALITWNLASGYMLSQREDSAIRQAQVNVRLVDEALRTGSEGLDELLTGLTTGPESSILLHQPGRWVTSGRQVDPGDLPAMLTSLARKGASVKQRVRIDGIPVLAVGLPVQVGHGFYIELFPLLQLDETFRFLSGLLVAGTVASALLGVALGAWASVRALRPLHELTSAASRVAAGNLRARLPEQSDRDLAPLAATFNTTADALERRVLRDARFASDVSHELRSPLTTLVNAAEVLNHQIHELPATARQAIELLTSALRGFQRMVVDLLEISRDDQGADDTVTEPVDVVELVQDVLAVRPDPPVHLDAEEPSPFVQGDRRKLDRVVTNLVDNARSHAGGAVRVGVLRRDGVIRLEVDDAGPGVPLELRERIFERFARGLLSGKRGTSTGNGLGLAIVSQHVTRHGGAVWVEDRPGGGARFVVTLAETQQ